MATARMMLEKNRPRVVGSFGNRQDLLNANAETLKLACDIAEVRLDLLEVDAAANEPLPWNHLLEIPLLFTARRSEEGGAMAMGPAKRMELLRGVLDHATWVDIEVASIAEMSELIAELKMREIPWIASYHDFEKLPADTELSQAALKARDAGAAVFKAAARLAGPVDVARLADFQLADHGIAVSTMGMGPLAPVSRLLCAQCGSVLNYGFIGQTATAPGQWSSALLKQAIAQLAPLDF